MADSVCKRCGKPIVHRNGNWEHVTRDRTTHYVQPKNLQLKGFGSRREAEEFGSTLAARDLRYRISHDIQNGMTVYYVEWRE